LRRLAAGRRRTDWEGHIHGRLATMPEEATPLQRAQLLAALSVGSEITRLRPLVQTLGLSAELESARSAVAECDSATAIGRLSDLDRALAAQAVAAPEASHGRGSVLALTEVLSHHAAFFDAGAGR
jgi:hypothetical protein